MATNGVAGAVAAPPDLNQVSKVDIKIVSPLPELQSGVTLHGISSDWTIAQLKGSIRVRLEREPPIERIRVIRLGRIARDTQTVGEVLGQTAVRSVLLMPSKSI